MKKKLIAAILALAMVFALAACGSSAAPAPTEAPAPADDTAAEETAAVPETRTVTDTWGREVEIPYTVESIVCLGSGAPRMAAYLDVVDMMVGVEDHDKENYTVLRDYNPVYRDEIKDLPSVGSGGGSGANNGYAEEIINLAPDVILAGFSAEAADELYGQTGVPVVCVRYLSRNFVDDSFYDAMRVFAEVVGAQERCEAVLGFIDGCKQDLADRTAGIPDSDKQTVYAGAVTFSGRHGFGGTYAHFGPFIGVNALNVADEAEDQNYYEVDLEKVIEWDPDVIFLDPGNMDLVNDEYSTNPGFFDSLRAIREGNVYTMPSFNNCGTNITYALMDAYYAGIVLYPEQFADVTMPQIGGEILTFMLGQDTFAEMEAGGLYYGTLTIGE